MASIAFDLDRAGESRHSVTVLQRYIWVVFLFFGLYLMIPLEGQESKAQLIGVGTPTGTETVVETTPYFAGETLPSLRISTAVATGTATIIGIQQPLVPTLPPIDSVTNQEKKTGELLVQFAPEVDPISIVQGFGHQLLSIPYLSDSSRIFKVLIPATEWNDETVSLYKQYPGITSVEYNKTLKTMDIGTPILPNDAFFSSQSNLHNVATDADIDAPEAWSITTGSSAVKVAVLDTGVDGTHIDLQGRVLAGQDYIGYLQGSPTPASVSPRAISAGAKSDDNGHGTGATGIIAAMGNNGTGMSGVAWNTQIIPVKVLDYNQSGDEASVASAILWATAQGADIICMSLGGPSPSLPLQNAIESAFNQGVLLVAASGNVDKSGVYYPAAYQQVLAVGATNSNDQRASQTDWGIGTSGEGLGTAYGPELDLLAPGTNIFTLGSTMGSINEYKNNFTGTSAAAPHVCGAAALLLAKEPELTNRQLMRRLLLGTDKVSSMAGQLFTSEYGYGRLNAYKTLQSDTTVPSAEILSTGTLPPLPTIRGKVTDVSSGNDRLPTFLANIPDSAIRSIELRIDGSTWIPVSPTPIEGGATFAYVVSTPLTTGNHLVEIRGMDSSNNTIPDTSISKSTVVVSQDITVTSTPITTSVASATATPTNTGTVATATNTTTPVATGTATTIAGYPLEVKVIYRFKRSDGSAIDFPMKGVKVTISSLLWESYTNLDGNAYFTQVPQGKAVVMANYGGLMRQLDVTLPDTKSATVVFETSASGSATTGLPVTGLTLQEQVQTMRVFAGFALFLLSLVMLWKTRKVSGG